MKFSKAKHFWTWFQKNANTYLELPTKTKEEAMYCMRELFTHLLAYGKGLEVEMFWGDLRGEDSTTLIVTAYGKKRHFRKGLYHRISLAPWTRST
jgi:hypothetical protein